MGPVVLQQVQAEPAPKAVATTVEAVPRKWLGRLTLAVGGARPSPQESVLDLDGYGSARYLVGAEVGGFLSEEVVLAGFALSSGRTDSSRRGGPTLREESYAAGVALPVAVRLSASNAVILSPRVGAGFGSQSFHGHPEYRAGLGFGADVAILVARGHFGFGLGFWSLRVPSGQGLAEANDFGSSYVLICGAVGG
jgi:hypothetical protein